MVNDSGELLVPRKRIIAPDEIGRVVARRLQGAPCKVPKRDLALLSVGEHGGLAFAPSSLPLQSCSTQFATDTSGAEEKRAGAARLHARVGSFRPKARPWPGPAILTYARGLELLVKTAPARWSKVRLNSSTAVPPVLFIMRTKRMPKRYEPQCRSGGPRRGSVGMLARIAGPLSAVSHMALFVWSRFTCATCAFLQSCTQACFQKRRAENRSRATKTVLNSGMQPQRGGSV